MGSDRDHGGIFISYRREETGGHAGRLYDRLSGHFGADRVFMDVDSIPFGDDFTQVIEDKVSKCDIMLVVIGRDWLSAADSKRRRRRIDSPDDWVRVEVETALQRDIRIVPVLVDEAKMPHPEYLPPSLQPLAHRHAFVLSRTGYQSDVSRLIAAIKEAARTDVHRTVKADRDEVAEAEIIEDDEIVEAEIVDEIAGRGLVDYWEARRGPGGRSGEPYESRQLAESEQKSRPASADREWQLDLLSGEGANKTFRLSSRGEVHEITVQLAPMKGSIIKVDGEPVAAGLIHNQDYSLTRLGSVVGTPVTITVCQGGPLQMRIDQVVVRIGHQDLYYRSEELRQSLNKARRRNEWVSQAVETIIKRHR